MTPPGFEAIYPVITFPARRGFWKWHLGPRVHRKDKRDQKWRKDTYPQNYRLPRILYFGRFILRAFLLRAFFWRFFFRAGFCEKGPFSRIRLGSNALVLRFYWGRIPHKWSILQVIHAVPPTTGGERGAIIVGGSPPFKKTAPEL